MLIDRVVTPGLAQVAYLVADEVAGVAAVIDPRRDVDIYVEGAAARGLRIVTILETHVHADFVSGARELAAATGGSILTSRLAVQPFRQRAIADGDRVTVGRLRGVACWTPGHTPEHLAYLLFDPEQGSNPVALFSGDLLFAGEVGRPDLLGDAQTRSLAGQLYQSLYGRLRHLDDDLIVYPGHTAGSSCGKQIGAAPHTTLGQERRFTYAFRAWSEEEFVKLVLADMPRPPTYYPVLKRINAEGPALLRELPDGDALTPAQVADRQTAGAFIIDARSPAAFGAGHIAGAISAGLGPNFTAWLGWLAPYDQELILVLEGERQFAQARTELRRIGLDRIAGYLDGGMAAWRAAGGDTLSLAQMPVSELAARLNGGGDGLEVLDVRAAADWAGGHIPSAVHRFAGEIAQGAAAPVDGARPVAVICGSGYRSSVVASLLQARGERGVANVAGGMNAWHAANLPTTHDV